MNTWGIIIAIGVGTYLFRVSMFILLGGRQLPTWTETPMALVAPAAIAAMVASMTLTSHGHAQLLPLAELGAIIVGFFTVRRTGNVMHAFTAGLPAFWLLSLVSL